MNTNEFLQQATEDYNRGLLDEAIFAQIKEMFQ